MREVSTMRTRVVLGLVAAGVLLATWRHTTGTPSFATAGVDRPPRADPWHCCGLSVGMLSCCLLAGPCSVW